MTNKHNVLKNSLLSNPFKKTLDVIIGCTGLRTRKNIAQIIIYGSETFEQSRKDHAFHIPVSKDKPKTLNTTLGNHSKYSISDFKTSVEKKYITQMKNERNIYERFKSFIELLEAGLRSKEAKKEFPNINEKSIVMSQKLLKDIKEQIAYAMHELPKEEKHMQTPIKLLRRMDVIEEFCDYLPFNLQMALEDTEREDAIQELEKNSYSYITVKQFEHFGFFDEYYEYAIGILVTATDEVYFLSYSLKNGLSVEYFENVPAAIDNFLQYIEKNDIQISHIETTFETEETSAQQDIAIETYTYDSITTVESKMSSLLFK